MDLAGGAVEVHRGPTPAGYAGASRVGRGGTLDLPGGARLPVDDILG